MRNASGTVLNDEIGRPQRSAANRKEPRELDLHLYKARHLIENFFAHSSSIGPSLFATRYEKTACNFFGGILL